MERDFTLSKYRKLCDALLESAYKSVTVRDYLSGVGGERIVILRHDVDVSAEKALVMASAERELDINSTYYFRMTPKIFRPEVIKEIAAMGHEVGYHYEVLDKAEGDVGKAMKLFEEELNEFRRICKVETIAMHGNPLTKHDNRSLWDRRNYGDYGLLGEAYLSVDFSEVIYFTDTGRSWNSRYSLKDLARTETPRIGGIRSTDDLIKLIASKEIDCLYINTHPKRWNDGIVPWLWELGFQSAKNCVKSCMRWKMR